MGDDDDDDGLDAKTACMALGDSAVYKWRTRRGTYHPIMGSGGVETVPNFLKEDEEEEEEKE